MERRFSRVHFVRTQVVCPECGNKMMVRNVDGRIQYHRAQGGLTCPGAEKIPALILLEDKSEADLIVLPDSSPASMQ